MYYCCLSATMAGLACPGNRFAILAHTPPCTVLLHLKLQLILSTLRFLHWFNRRLAYQGLDSSGPLPSKARAAERDPLLKIQIQSNNGYLEALRLLSLAIVAASALLYTYVLVQLCLSTPDSVTHWGSLLTWPIILLPELGRFSGGGEWPGHEVRLPERHVTWR